MGRAALRPAAQTAPLIGGGYIEYLFLVMLGLCVVALATARAIERSGLGFGFAAIRDDEAAAEASGVPTLKLKLIATALSGGFMGMAGAPLPYYVTYLDPSSGFSLNYAVNAIAMPLIGGTSSWLGPVVGAVLVGGLQEYLGDDLLGDQRAGRGRADGRVRDRGAARALSACSQRKSGDRAAAHVSGLGKRFGGFIALQEIELEVRQGERLGLIGPNGSGKSTLVNCICGTLRNETGQRALRRRRHRQPDRA